MVDETGADGELNGVLAETATAPVVAAKRIDSIDTLRGLALCGILVMNIPFFALTSFAMFKPARAGGFEGLDYATWLTGHLLFDMKMMSIFSMLFGAGIVLFARKAIVKHGKAAGLHYRRMGWLLLFGLIHAYLIWEGDILVMYAMCGMLFFPLWKLPAKWLTLIAIVFLSVVPLINTGFGVSMKSARAEYERFVAVEAAGEPTEAFDLRKVDAWAGKVNEKTGERSGGLRDEFYPTEEKIEKEAAAVRGVITDRIEHRAPGVIWMQTFLFLWWGIWRAGGCFVLGMALFKWGVFSAARSTRFYALLAAIGFAIGWPIIGVGVRYNTAHEFDVVHQFIAGMNFNYVASMFVALGWVGLIMLMCKSNALQPVQKGLAAVGRMAFTNYIGQSVICSFIFFGLSGLGLGLFGELSRAQLVPIVVGIWVFQIIFSMLWLKRFRFGPLEWAWRSLTYGKVQPMSRSVRSPRSLS